LHQPTQAGVVACVLKRCFADDASEARGAGSIGDRTLFLWFMSMKRSSYAFSCAYSVLFCALPASRQMHRPSKALPMTTQGYPKYYTKRLIGGRDWRTTHHFVHDSKDHGESLGDSSEPC
jgi:hypothetical protein